VTRADLIAGILHRLAGESGETHRAVMSTGYPSLDRQLGGGLRAGELIVLGGDAGAGATSLLMGLALRAAVNGTEALVLSSEATPELAWERLLAAESGVSHVAMRTGLLPADGAADLRAAARVLTGLPLHVEVSPHSPAGLAERLDSDSIAPLVLLDGLAAIDAPPRPLAEAHAQVLRLLKRVAVARESVIICTAPMSVDRTHTPIPRPSLADFGALGTVAQVADAVLAVYREGLYDDAPDVAGAFEVHVLKHRSVGPGYADLFIEPVAGRVEDLTDA
jgi:replicative DNA helicase